MRMTQFRTVSGLTYRSSVDKMFSIASRGYVLEIMIKELIKNRRSVRTFDGRPLSERDLQCLKDYAGALTNPFGVPIEFRFLNEREHGVSSVVVVGADLYVAAKVERRENFEMAFGYTFERLCLYAQSMGVGSVMLAATISRKAFEKAMEIGENEVMPLASPLGYPAKERSIRESLMRRTLKADERLPFEALFFDGSFCNPLTRERAGKLAGGLEMARLSPSAGNRQPSRAVLADNAVHFYENKTMKDNALGDIQKVDVGIALAHFDLTLREEGVSGRFLNNNPALDVPEGMHYMISYVSGEEV